jgi:hypothetical protein
MSAAEKLFEKMKATLNGWGQNDFKKLYLGYGFDECGTKHAIYIHPEYPELRATVSRHNSLPPAYASQAVKIISRLKELQQTGLEKENVN